MLRIWAHDSLKISKIVKNNYSLLWMFTDLATCGKPYDNLINIKKVKISNVTLDGRVWKNVSL